MKLTRRWRWVLGLYAVLLLASWFFSAFVEARRGAPPLSELGYQSVLCSPYTDEGEYTQRRMSVHLACRVENLDDADKPALILLHGSPGDAADFERIGPLLAPHFRLIAPDLPGFGHTTATGDIPDFGIKAQARYVLEMMDELHLEHAAVLGFSLGSGTALELSALAPDRVDALILYGGIGIQEGEGSGDHHFEHLKYSVSFPLIVWLPEALPHFGKLGTYDARRAFMRSFTDTDQRPLRGIIEAWNDSGKPMLILHGAGDPLVPLWTARRHHDLVRDSELVVFDAGHFMLFSDKGARQLADEVVPFVERVASGGQVRRRTVDPATDRPGETGVLPIDLDIRRGTSPWAQMGAIVLATFVLEDPTSIAVGLLIRGGELDLFVGVLAIFIGIFVGDWGLYLVGRTAGRRALRWRPIAKRLPVRHVEALGRWFDTHGWTAVLLSRFVPGMRFPVYVSAGVLGNRPWRFMLWTLGAVAVWAPTILFIVIVLGEATSPLRAVLGSGWLALLVAMAVILAVLRVVLMLLTAIGRAKLRVTVGRWTHHEFWPAWVFYAPLAPYVAWLCLRHRSFSAWTAANPGIPHGGVVGESKWDILSKLPPQWVQPTLHLPVSRESGVGSQGSGRSRLEALREHAEREHWALPLILKPDQGQRGAGLRRVKTWEEAGEYLERNPVDVLAQTYHPGPWEAGIFYYRFPHEERGRILSVTDKVFPVLGGDGKHTVEMLIWRHPRFRMQARLFLQRLEDELDRVPPKGERIALGIAGNHCQGTLFRDGSHLVTEALRRRIDAIARAFDGFYFGRFDVRYADPGQLRNGEGFAIIELNGVTSESTNLYDPSWLFPRAYRVLFAQWRILYAIGAANRQRGARVIGVIPLLRLVRKFYRERRGELNAD